MPRPRKCRRVCGLPAADSFAPCGWDISVGAAVTMTVDEFEAIRLIDAVGLNQEQCAERMDVARTTAQRIYESARRKLADCLVNGKRLRIAGGDFTVYDGHENPREEKKCCRHGSGCGCGHG